MLFVTIDKDVFVAQYDVLFNHKKIIEEQIGLSLNWDRAERCKASWVGCLLKDVSITNEADWSRMAKFHAELSEKYGEVFLPYFQFDNSDADKLSDIARIFREWTVVREDIIENVEKCNNTYTRFTTDAMSKILPDIVGAPSGWGTDNHYFYKIINCSGRGVYIQLALSSRNATDDFMDLCNRINKYYPSRIQRDNWRWRAPFRTTTVEFGENTSKDAIFAVVDDCMKEIRAFEVDLKAKLDM